jgi:hypothetical protein
MPSLHIKDTNFVFLKQRAFGGIFVDYRSSRVRKVSLKNNNTQRQQWDAFIGELEAYYIASAHNILREWIPEFYGSCVSEVVCSETYMSLTNDYHTWSIEMALIKNLSGEVAAFEEASKGVYPSCIENLFKQAGIRTNDASISRDASPVKVIDISTAPFPYL